MLINCLESSVKLLSFGDDSGDERVLAGVGGTTLAGLLSLSLGASGLGLGAALGLSGDGLGLGGLSNSLGDELLVLALLPLRWGLSGGGSTLVSLELDSGGKICGNDSRGVEKNSHGERRF